MVSEAYSIDPLEGTWEFKSLKPLLGTLRPENKVRVMEIMNGGFRKLYTYLLRRCGHATKPEVCTSCKGYMCGHTDCVESRCDRCHHNFCDNADCKDYVQFTQCCGDRLCIDCIQDSMCTDCGVFVCKSRYCRANTRPYRKCKDCDKVICHLCMINDTVPTCGPRNLMLCQTCQPNWNIRPCTGCTKQIFCAPVRDVGNTVWDVLGTSLPCTCNRCGEKHFCRECSKTAGIETCHEINRTLRKLLCTGCKTVYQGSLCKHCGTKFSCECRHNCQLCRKCTKEHLGDEIVTLMDPKKRPQESHRSRRFWRRVIGEGRSVLQ